MSNRSRLLAVAVLAAGLAGCAAGPRTGQSAPQGAAASHHHGAAPETAAPATAVSSGQPAKTLSAGPVDAPAATSVADAQRSAEMAELHGGHAGHGAGAYRHVDAGRGPEASEGSETPAAGGEEHHHHHQPQGAQDAEDTAGAEEAAAVYACPMHPEVTSAAPGSCSKCGMDLVKRGEG